MPTDLHYKNIKKSSLERKKIIPDRNLDLYKAMKSVRNGINKSWIQTPAPIIPKFVISLWTLSSQSP